MSLPACIEATRESRMFSPILAILPAIACSTVCSGSKAHFAAFAASASARPSAIAWSASAWANSWYSAVRATKSVSQLSSTIPARRPSADRATATRPSFAVRPAFLAAADRPFLRRIFTASSRSPFDSARAR